MKSAKLGADVGRQTADIDRFSQILLTDLRATIGLRNATVALRNKKSTGVTK